LFPPVDLLKAQDGRIVLRSTSPVPGRRMECVMSMQPQPWPQPAQEIVVAVRAMSARRRAPLPVQVRDQLGELFADEQFAAAFGVRGKPAWSPGRLALVTVLACVLTLVGGHAKLVAILSATVLMVVAAGQAAFLTAG
jgi:hypothetical protein